ncbi:hypothetical protein A9Q86_09630 [Flavobacteriales bacterium 33_180_T64]|nr:hypothetical protein A9Q86_09630 [Flavobacteriales bacterium 33_180_T64]
MKSFFLILIISFTTISCGNDDDSINNNSEKLIGNWKIIQRLVDNTESTLGECESFSEYSYNQSGTYNELYYAAVINSDCLNNPSIEFIGTWEKNNSNTYSFTNSQNEVSEFTIEFSSNTSFSKTFTSLFNINDPIIQTITEEYIRIE